MKINCNIYCSIQRSLLSQSSPKKSFSPKKSRDSPKKAKAGPSQSHPSSSQASSAAAAAAASEASRAAAARKWKKGMQTPKQRLSKILKMGKFFSH